MNLIDVPQVITQIIGFLLLVWLLGKFAWGPVLAMLEARRQAIAGQFDQAERAKAEAHQLKLKYEQELKTIDQQARQKIQEAVSEGQRVASEIKSQAQNEATRRVERAGEEIAREREKAKELVKEQVIRLSMRTAEKILRQKLDEPTQRQLVSEFVDEVDELGEVGVTR
jgi:F-type H+-transporting ATPase subunit b